MSRVFDLVVGTIMIVMLALLLWAVFIIGNLRMELENEVLFSEHIRMSLAYEQRRIPICQEDAILVPASGAQFEAGQFDAYACGPSWDDE